MVHCASRLLWQYGRWIRDAIESEVATLRLRECKEKWGSPGTDGISLAGKTALNEAIRLVCYTSCVVATSDRSNDLEWTLDRILSTRPAYPFGGFPERSVEPPIGFTGRRPALRHDGDSRDSAQTNPPPRPVAEEPRRTNPMLRAEHSDGEVLNSAVGSPPNDANEPIGQSAPVNWIRRTLCGPPDRTGDRTQFRRRRRHERTQ